jgi:putative transposase
MTKTTTIDPKLIDQLLEQTAPEDLLAENGLIKQFAKAILERALQAEMSTHLDHEPGESVSNEAGNKRNGTTSKTVQGELGKLEISVPLDPEHAPDGQGRLETVKARSSHNWSRNVKPDCAVWTRGL